MWQKEKIWSCLLVISTTEGLLHFLPTGLNRFSSRLVVVLLCWYALTRFIRKITYLKVRKKACFQVDKCKPAQTTGETLLSAVMETFKWPIPSSEKEKRMGQQAFLWSLAKLGKKLSFIPTGATHWPALLAHAIYEVTSFDSQSHCI